MRRLEHRSRPARRSQTAVAEDRASLKDNIAAAVREQGRLDLLAVDGAGLFAEGLARGGDGHAALRACMDGAWELTHATINDAFLQAGESGGRVVYLAAGTGR